ncbi:diacylglycerol lipase-alpha-like isoform X2 [Myxocyprinus asiaticus]|uniref:diacylglycerol lipase-alpha-like isoform X2 n=1 Tax=Myxocyprinus asiaticus TaxID=70543 RepID=UPI002223E70B|nr:diacylglycerol lipase-alpha-like isoform X2 [Myxocyprinus asiaticus]
MPGMVLFRRRWSVGSDDLVLPAFFLFILHCIWLVVLSVVLFGLPYSSEQSCSVTLVDHGRGYLGILVSCLICESAIMWLSMRGSILYTQPREAVQYVLYIRLAILLVELVYAVVGITWLVQYYHPCSDITAKNLTLGIVACNWLVIFSVCFTMMCTFDPTGRTFVKLKATRRRQRNLTTYTLRHRLEEGQASSWSRRLKFFMCCTRAQDTQSDAYSEVASLFAEFFRDLDIVPSDIIAGLVLLRQRQRAKRSAILDQANNDVLAFLSGMPVTRNTKYLDLKNSAEMAMYKEVCYYMLFAMAAYGWPMYLLKKTACGLCRLVSTCSCNTSVSGSRLSQSVTVEEDNCCGCNVLAIRRQFLDRDLKEVQIVYTSCHDAVYETPFFVAVDHAKKKVVISIRGTLSPKDALTDLTGDSERLPLEEQHGTWLGHKGMVYSAEYIKKKLEQEMILSQAFGRDLGKGTMHYGLVIVGHSLGAGTAAILSFLLRPQYPSLHCYAYSPPGGLLSEDAMEYSKDFVTSVVLGKDLVPRIGLSQLEGFRRHLLEVLQKSEKPKWRIIAGGTKCIPKSELPMDDGPPLSQGVTPSNSRLCLHPSDLSIALSASTPLYPPGRVIHVVHNHPPETCCGQEEPTYSALWGDNKAFDEVIISSAMLNEHMPHVVMDGLNKVLETPFFISELNASQVGSQRTSTRVRFPVLNTLPDTPLMPLVPDECLVVPEACSVPLTFNETSSLQPQSSDTQEQSLLLNNTVNPLMPTSNSVTEISNTQNFITGTPNPIASPTMSVPEDTYPIGSDTILSDWPGDISSTLQQSDNTSLHQSLVPETSAGPSRPDFPTLVCDTSRSIEPKNYAQSSLTLSVVDPSNSPALETPSSVQDSTTPLDSTLFYSKMSDSPSEASFPPSSLSYNTPPETPSQFAKLSSSAPSSESSTPSLKPSNCPSSSEFLLNPSPTLGPNTQSEGPPTRLMAEGSSAQLSTENHSLKPPVFDNTSLTPLPTDHSQTGLSSSTSPSEETSTVLTRNNLFRPSIATCYVSNI